jgi:hypothetical protein
MKKRKTKQAEIVPMESARQADKKAHDVMLGHFRKAKRGKNGKSKKR